MLFTFTRTYYFFFELLKTYLNFETNKCIILYNIIEVIIKLNIMAKLVNCNIWTLMIFILPILNKFSSLFFTFFPRGP